MGKLIYFYKDYSARLIFLILTANLFYDDPTLYLYKRIMYSICIYAAVFEIGRFYYQNYKKENLFRAAWFDYFYLPLLGIFILIALSLDLTNPSLKWITLINNPFCLLSAGPIMLYMIGANSESLDKVFDVLLIAFCAFCVVASFPIFGRVKYYQGYISAYAFVPFFILSLHLKRYKVFAALLLLVGIYFSGLSDYRIIAMRILLFGSLLVGLTVVRKSGFLKFLILLVSCIALYHFIANLADVLALFKELLGLKSFDDDDTRGFLWSELFGELKGMELFYGRGFVGTYFSEYFLMILIHYNTYSDHYDRFSIEVGFLELILKGGFFWYFLFITPMLVSSIKGIFVYHKDPLIFHVSIFLFVELMLMFIENIPYFSFQFSLLFFLSGYILKRMYEIKHNRLGTLHAIME
ncbi:MAG: hypothetical protein MUF42_14325 [Cytophagaceae bacterium]|jgi:hypothetical protein|nr:hypothetical protein [Cytophagaceae bacterium]